MITSFVIYNPTGRIVRTGACPSEMVEFQAGQDEYVIVGSADSLLHYIDGGKIVERPVNPAKLHGMQLTNVPVPSTLYINGKLYSGTESTIDLDFTYPGEYTIFISAFPYRDATFTVTV